MAIKDANSPLGNDEREGNNFSSQGYSSLRCFLGIIIEVEKRTDALKTAIDSRGRTICVEFGQKEEELLRLLGQYRF